MPAGLSFVSAAVHNFLPSGDGGAGFSLPGNVLVPSKACEAFECAFIRGWGFTLPGSLMLLGYQSAIV